MATDTAPPVPAGPPDPHAAPGASTAPTPTGDTGIMAALMAAVEPARPVTATAGARPEDDDPAAKADLDGVVDRSSPGVTSGQFKAPEDLAGAGSDAAGARHKEGVLKTLIRAGATRWAKGGGTANKRLDLEKARAGAHQVKEARTTTVMKSPGLPTRNGSGGAGGGGIMPAETAEEIRAVIPTGTAPRVPDAAELEAPPEAGGAALPARMGAADLATGAAPAETVAEARRRTPAPKRRRIQQAKGRTAPRGMRDPVERLARTERPVLPETEADRHRVARPAVIPGRRRKSPTRERVRRPT
ncbi:hypothetical protein SMICM304S_04447 [Streptomyces microflavus]